MNHYRKLRTHIEKQTWNMIRDSNSDRDPENGNYEKIEKGNNVVVIMGDL